MFGIENLKILWHFKLKKSFLIEELPKGLGSLKLESIILHNTNIRIISNNLNGFIGLKTLHISKACKLASLPVKIGDLS